MWSAGVGDILDVGTVLVSLLYRSVLLAANALSSFDRGSGTKMSIAINSSKLLGENRCS